MLTRSRRWFAPIILAMVVLAGCGDEGSSGTTVPDGLLSPETVGGQAVGNSQRYVLNGSPCNVDSIDLYGGATDQNTMAYRRDVDGQSEVVLLGSWHWSKKMTTAAMRSARAALSEDPECGAGPGTVELLDTGTDDDSLAFSLAWTNQEGKHFSMLRSYTYVEPEEAHLTSAARLVMVSIRRTGESGPSRAELARLTRAQVAKTEKVVHAEVDTATAGS